MKSPIAFILSLILILESPLLLSQSSYRTPASIRDFQQTVQSDKKNAKIWWCSWIGGYSALTAVQGMVAISSDEKSVRQDMVLGAATTFLGAVGTILSPVVPGKSYMLDQGFRANDSSKTMNYYETMLREIAAREKAGRSWKVHAAAGVVDLGSGLVTWLGYKRTVWDGVINFALNTVIAEAQIWSQPMRAARDYKKYLAAKGRNLPITLEKPKNRLYFGAYPGGLMIKAVF
jgi:hypothetical protein